MLKYYLIIIICIISFSIQNSFSELNPISSQIDYESLLTKFWNWWINLSKEEMLSSQCLMHYNTESSVLFLLNPFEFDNMSYDCQTYSIPKKSIIFFPLISGWCTNGDKGYRYANILQLTDCAYNQDRGLIKGKVFFDGNKIINLEKINEYKEDIVKKKFLDNRTINSIVDDRGFYKELITKKLVDIIVTNKTQYKFDKLKEFAEKPIAYKGSLHCNCIIFNASEVNSGVHTIQYKTKANSMDPQHIGEGWNYDENSIIYTLNFE